jgi:hypothetical protein
MMLARRSDTVLKNGSTRSKKKGVIRIIAINRKIKAALFSFSQIEIIMAARNTTDRKNPNEIRIFCNIPGISIFSKVQKLNVFATFLNINRLLLWNDSCRNYSSYLKNLELYKDDC